jgi:protoporphyrinogen oxidase
MNAVKQKENELVIIGGGMIGLSAAYLAAREGKKVTLIEASNTFGGLLNTFEIGNNRLEYYYHHFFTHDAELNWLIKELKIDDKLTFIKTTMGVFQNGKMYDFNTPLDLFKFEPISFTDKIKFALTSLYLGKIASWEKYEYTSCMEWFRKWAGKSTTASLWAPLLNIKFGPFASEVPLSWMVGRLRQRMNSRKNGDERLGYLDGSFQVLVDALVDNAKKMNVTLINNALVEKINIRDNGVYSVITPKGEITGQKFLFTIPGMYISKLLVNDLPEFATKLDSIKYFGAICVVLELNRPLSHIYWMNIAEPGFPFGGIIEHTNLIKPDKYNGSHIVYLSRYFAMEEKIATMTHEEIQKLMLQYLPNIYTGFKEEWIKNIFVFKTNTAAPVCDFGYSKKMPDCKTQLNNMFIANVNHVYPDERGMNNSIRIAAEACRVMGIDTVYVPKGNSMAGQIGF